jgi:hypothetical protein
MSRAADDESDGYHLGLEPVDQAAAGGPELSGGSD